MVIRGLGQVQAVTRRAAEEFVTAFPAFTGVIGGYRATGSVANSDHPKGLAIDVMESNIPVANKYANWFLANGARLGVTYVIHNRQIFFLSKGKWEPYSGPSPHTDHVHVSFTPAGGDPNAPVSNLGQTGSAMDMAGCIAQLFGKGSSNGNPTGIDIV